MTGTRRAAHARATVTDLADPRAPPLADRHRRQQRPQPAIDLVEPDGALDVLDAHAEELGEVLLAATRRSVAAFRAMTSVTVDSFTVVGVIRPRPCPANGRR